MSDQEQILKVDINQVLAVVWGEIFANTVAAAGDHNKTRAAVAVPFPGQTEDPRAGLVRYAEGVADMGAAALLLRMGENGDGLLRYLCDEMVVRPPK